MTQPRFLSALVIVCAVGQGSAIADPVYTKTFYTHKVQADAVISAGARVQTWSGDRLVGDNATLKAAVAAAPPNPAVPAVQKPYTHANGLTGSKTINEGLPIRSTDLTAATGYDPGEIQLTDDHRNPNSATAAIKVDPRVAAGPRVEVRLPPPPGPPPPPGQPPPTTRKQLADSVKTVISGSAHAGKPVDFHTWHSADSFGAVELAGAQTFSVVENGQIPVLEAFAQTVMSGGVDNTAPGKDRGGNRDPLFVTLADLDTGSLTREAVMRQDLDWVNAQYSLDDSGIRLAVASGDPGSFVSLVFETLSNWVLDPYTYGARLDASGLTAFGATPLSGWIVTTGPIWIEAFFPFGPGGQPFDFVQVRPPESLLSVGHSYRYDVGAGGGVFEVANVPEPSSLVLFGSLLLWFAYLTRRTGRRQGRVA
jgi:hypothetical protein